MQIVKAFDNFDTEFKVDDQVWVTKRTRRPAHSSKEQVAYLISYTQGQTSGVPVVDPNGNTNHYRALGRHTVTGERTDDLTGGTVYLVDLDS